MVELVNLGSQLAHNTRVIRGLEALLTAMVGSLQAGIYEQVGGPHD